MLRLLEFLDSQHMKVARLSALLTGRLCLPGKMPGTQLCYRLSRTQRHSAAVRIMSMKNYSDRIGNRTRDLPACGTVPPTNCNTAYPFCNIREGKKIILKLMLKGRVEVETGFNVSGLCNRQSVLNSLNVRVFSKCWAFLTSWASIG
jgi:hypothetical protein